MDSFSKAISYLPPDLRKVFKNISPYDRAEIQEIRIRSGQYLHVTIRGKEYCVTRNGGISDNLSTGIYIEHDLIDDIFSSVCEYSVHSHEETLLSGFITIDGGSRVGFGSSANQKNGQTSSVRFINSINIRIAKQIVGCADLIYESILLHGIKNVLIAGAPSSGKTTILRDLCRILGNEYRISLIDERSEIACCRYGVPENDVGIMTDILDNYRRSDGIEIALRSLSPQIIVCDEISNQKDSEAISNVSGCGVSVIASVHSPSFDDLKKNKIIYKLVKQKVFDYVIFLKSGCETGKINDIIEL